MAQFRPKSFGSTIILADELVMGRGYVIGYTHGFILGIYTFCGKYIPRYPNITQIPDHIYSYFKDKDNKLFIFENISHVYFDTEETIKIRKQIEYEISFVQLMFSRCNIPHVLAKEVNYYTNTFGKG